MQAGLSLPAWAPVGTEGGEAWGQGLAVAGTGWMDSHWGGLPQGLVGGVWQELSGAGSLRPSRPLQPPSG